jgi:two-component system LytT family response regulator
MMNPLARSIVREYLQNYPDIEIVQECNDGFEGVKAIQQHQPELIFPRHTNAQDKRL